MKLLLAALLLLAPGNKQWSKAHKLGVSIPKTWTILERDAGARAFVVEGPLLGNGKPRLVVWNMGAAGSRTLKQMAEKFDSSIRKRSGWRRITMTDHTVGPWRAMRLAYSFQEQGKAKGRARVSVVLFGGAVFVLEMSGAARGFPAATFDQIEKSLEAKWTDVALPAGAKASVPPGWEVLPTEDGFRAAGPRDAVVIIQRDDGTAPEGSKEGGKLEFLGKKRVVRVVTREVRGASVQMRWLHHEGWTGVVIMPVEAWKEVGPGARAILAGLKLPPRRDGKKD